MVVLPPGMVGGEVDVGRKERRVETIDVAAFVLADSDRRVRIYTANGFMHTANPACKFFLSKKNIVVYAKRVDAVIHAARRKLFFGGKRDCAGDGAGENVPGGSEGGAVWIFLSEPGIPGGEFDGIIVGAHAPELFGKAGFVDEIPGEKRNIVEAAGDGTDQRLLSAHGFTVEVGIRAAENFGKEGKEIELYGELIFTGGHQVGFKGAKGAVVGAAGFVAELIPAGPPARANHVEASAVDEGEIAVPHVDVGMIEEEALDFTGHIGGADYGERFVVDREVVRVDGEMGAGTKESFIANQKAE